MPTENGLLYSVELWPPATLYPTLSHRHRCRGRLSTECARFLSQAILLTAGANGAAFYIRGQQGFIPCFTSCKITETTGAGDAFSAGFIARCIQLMSNSTQGQQKPLGARALDLDVGGETAQDLVRFGSAVGALTCCGDGAIAPQPSTEQVMELLAAKEWLAAVN